MRKIDLSKIKVTGVANNSVLVYNNVSSSWVASNTVAANLDWSYIGNVPYANSSANGVVKIVDSTANTSNSIAASANSVKSAYDAATSAAAGAVANGAAAYSNAVTYAGTIAATAYSNAVSTASSDATTKAATAYTNAVAYAAANSYVNTQLGLKASLSGATFSGAVSGITTLAAGNTTITGFANVSTTLQVTGAVTFSNTLSVAGNVTGSAANVTIVAGAYTTTFANTGATTFPGAVSGITTLAAGNTTITGSANVSANLSANNLRTYGSVQIDGDLTVSGNTVTVNVTNLAVEDNLIYLNSGSTVSHPDLGFAGNYNDGTYRHAGFFRDATDGVWKIFDQYVPEPDASAYIDTANNTFRIADFQANTVTLGTLVVSNTTVVTNLNAEKLGGQTGSYYAANSQLASYTLLTGSSALSVSNTLAAGNTTITGFANVSANLNTSGTLSANVITVTGNVTTTQTNLQVDAAGTATAMAIVFGG